MRVKLLIYVGVVLLIMSSVVFDVAQALAIDYPTRPVTIIVPFPAGGSTDIQARMIAKDLSERIGKAVIVDNRPGAGGRIGMGLAPHAAPDGHTLVMGSVSTLALEPALHSNIGYEVQRDFVPITLISEMPFVLIVSPRLPVKDVAELLAEARR